MQTVQTMSTPPGDKTTMKDEIHTLLSLRPLCSFLVTEQLLKPVSVLGYRCFAHYQHDDTIRFVSKCLFEKKKPVGSIDI